MTGGGAGGGLFASAGTPHGQSAGAGLGGVVDKSGQTAGMNILFQRHNYKWKQKIFCIKERSILLHKL